MGPPSRSLAAEALGCYLVRITGGSNRIQDRGAMIAPDGGFPSDCRCKNLRPRDGARTRTGDLKTSLTRKSPYKGRVDSTMGELRGDRDRVLVAHAPA